MEDTPRYSISPDIIAEVSVVFETTGGEILRIWDERQFTTSIKLDSAGSFTDSRDGNTYEYVTIGSQIWTSENMKFLPQVSRYSGYSFTDPSYYVYDFRGITVTRAKRTDNYDTSGVLYNWEAAKTACPEGWQLPFDEEWTVMSEFLGVDAGLKIKSTSGWKDNGNGNNSSGFNALPAGLINQYGSHFAYIEEDTYYWSASPDPDNSEYASFWFLSHWSDHFDQISHYRNAGYSVRCIKSSEDIPMIISTVGLEDISTNSAKVGNIKLNEGGAAVTNKGVCWNTTGNPTVSDSKTDEGEGMEEFSSILDGLREGTRYFIRAYATNLYGTGYGEQFSFKTLDGKIRDSRDGQEYEYIELGNQAWLARNMAWLPEVSSQDRDTLREPYFSVYGYDGINVTEAKESDNFKTCGVLYNWEAANIACPDGWHLPSDKEWKVLEKYLGMSDSQLDSETQRESGSIGRKIKSQQGWFNNGNGDNSTGFNALQAGYYMHLHGFNHLEGYSTFWTSTPSYWGGWQRGLNYYNDAISRSTTLSRMCISVRCVRD